MLGELEVLADGVKLPLPQSKKTRALLGYLLLTGHEHRRDRLCSLLWDVADDPRAALRWSLSKLRELVDSPSLKRLGGDREHIVLDASNVYVDALEVPRLLGANPQNAASHALIAARELFRGELLEGIDLEDFHGFSAWLLAERTRFRELHRCVLNTLIAQSGGHPERVLPFIRALVQVDPSDENARAKLLEVLHATGAIGEAHEAARANQRLMAPAAAASPSQPSAANASPRGDAQTTSPSAASASARRDARTTSTSAAGDAQRASETTPLIGRDAELAVLRAWLMERNAKLRAWLIEGDAGLGKSRLLRECERMAEAAGARCVRVRVPDARPGWPYAALQSLLAQLDRDHKGPLLRLVEASVSPQPSAAHAPTSTTSVALSSAAPTSTGLSSPPAAAAASTTLTAAAGATIVPSPPAAATTSTTLAGAAPTTGTSSPPAAATTSTTPAAAAPTTGTSSPPAAAASSTTPAAAAPTTGTSSPPAAATTSTTRAATAPTTAASSPPSAAAMSTTPAVAAPTTGTPSPPAAAASSTMLTAATLTTGGTSPPIAAADRDELLRSVQAVLERAASAHSPLLLLLDDVHFLDEASVELLYHCALNLRAQRIGFVLSARAGELHDRPSLARTMRALRREHILEELRLSALTREQTCALLGGNLADTSAQQVFEWSGGNPLFALMLRAGNTQNTLPRSLAQLVQDRVSSLPAEHTDVLRWAAVLGAVFRTDPLRQLVGLDDHAFVEALEALERHAWLSLQADVEDHARFAHQIVQRALYDQLSEPRKRLMHAKVAQLMTAKPSTTLEHTSMLAHHAALGGDRALAVRAYQAAAQRCIRVYAHADAVSLARRGLVQAAQLPEPDQTCLALELYQAVLHAGLPGSPDDLLPELVRLTERALDLGAVGHAHMGFHLRAYVKWQNGDCADALRYSREVERISRLAAPEQRARALADSARCLAQLERDLSDAEAFVNEAELLADAAQPPAGLPLARGILTLFRGDYARAETELPHARQLAARAGNRLEEFYALEFCVYLELAREEYPAALALCAELTSTAERLRGGSEVPFARALEALIRVLAGLDSSFERFDQHYTELAVQDAKQRCAFLSAEASQHAAASGNWAYAQSQAQSALALARAVDRATESALAWSVLVRAELAAQDAHVSDTCAALRACLEKPVSAFARRRAEAALSLVPSTLHIQEKLHGNRDRRARVRGAGSR